jgi:DNA-binding XRE family transcriptional regulator
MAKEQIIYDDTGAPAFVVIPYARFRALAPATAETALSDEALFDLAVSEKDDRSAVPHDAMIRLIEGENPLKVYREWRGLTQAELARKIAVSKGYVSQVERGTRTLSRKARAAAAKALGILPDLLD